MMGWASAPYDPFWARRHPRRAAWMALAGPAANFALVLIAAILIHIGLFSGYFQVPNGIGFTSLVAAKEGVAEGAATFLSILFSLNLLLGVFNLIPFPPLDGFAVLGLFVTEGISLKLMDWRDSMGGFMMIGIFVAWKIFDKLFEPVFITGVRFLYAPYF
jgi:Zn-dependent protease